MIMGNYNKEILELDIRKENIAENARKHTIEYHNGLIKLLEAKVNGNTEGILKLSEAVNDNLSKVISLNNAVIEISFDIAKKTLSKAFLSAGLKIEENTNERV
tara:strand:- start:533 stop:841 length:309 start_codon:yes stop_codon:yes gene_type:complete